MRQFPWATHWDYDRQLDALYKAGFNFVRLWHLVEQKHGLVVGIYEKSDPCGELDMRKKMQLLNMTNYHIHPI